MADAASPVNFYETLGLDPAESLAEIQAKLAELKSGWTVKASRAGGLGERARETLALIADAEGAFVDEDSRDRFDALLRRAPAAATETVVDWTARAWSYYFTRDQGAALVAARKAREQNPNSPAPFVVSAWIKLRDDEDSANQQAKEFADEAYVLDENGDSLVDVHHARGAVYAAIRQYDRALQSFDRALTGASDEEKPEIYMRKAVVLEQTGDASALYESAVAGLTTSVEISDWVSRRLIDSTVRGIVLVDELDAWPRTEQEAEDARSRAEARRATIARGGIQPAAKESILGSVDALAEIATRSGEAIAENARQTAEMDALQRRINGVKPVAPGNKPDNDTFKWGGFGCGGILLLAGLPLLAANGAGIVFLLLGIVGMIVGGVAVSNSNKWKEASAAFTRTNEHTQGMHQELERKGRARQQTAERNRAELVKLRMPFPSGTFSNSATPV